MPSKQEKKTGSEGRVKMGNEALSDLAALQAFGFNNMTSFGTAWIEALSDMGSTFSNPAFRQVVRIRLSSAEPRRSSLTHHMIEASTALMPPADAPVSPTRLTGRVSPNAPGRAPLFRARR